MRSFSHTHASAARRGGRLLLVAALAALVALSALSPAAAQEQPAATTLRFDFGGPASPVADGYTQVTNTTLYTPERGYGLDRETAFRDRGEPDDLRRDFTNGSGYEFRVDVPDGDYHVTVISGDQIASNRTDLTVEGVAQGRLSPSAGSFAEHRTIATVSDGQLTIGVATDGRLNGVMVTQVSAPTGVRVSDMALWPEQAVTLAWDGLEGAASYTVYRSPAGEDAFTTVGTTTAPSFTDTDVDLGYRYDYAVAQVTGDGVESARSEPLTVAISDDTVAVPATPGEVRLRAATRDETTLTWDPVDDVRHYEVFRADETEGPYTRIATVTDPAFRDDGGATVNFFYRVVAVNEGGVSEPSATVKAPITEMLVRQAEDLDRGVVAVATDDGVFVSWRLLGTDPDRIAFNVYRDGEQVNDTPVTESTNLVDDGGSADATYQVRPVLDGRELDDDELGASEAVPVWAAGHLDIPLDKPAGGTTPDGEAYTYTANDASVGDLDGDGEYEIVLKWDPTNSQDNSRAGYTGDVLLDAYELDGTRLWRIDLGRNIRAGAHYTQFLVYDLDGDGRAEVVMKTADATTDGTGEVIGDPDADHRASDGYVLEGPEYLTVFDGATGAALDTTEYDPPRGDVCDWGDCYGNRVDRFLAGVAYLDGERPSFVMARGYYTRSVLVAYDYRDGDLTKRWTFDTDEPGLEAYAGQGNHSLAVADVDDDGRDEIVYGAMAVDGDGSPLHTSGLGHGDAQHVSDLDPTRPGLEIFGVHEDPSAEYGLALRDGESGEVIWGVHTGRDTGRGLAADIDPRYPGAEAWAVEGAWNAATGWLLTAQGEQIATAIPPANNAIWWDGDLGRELLDHDFSEEAGVGVGTIADWDPQALETERLLTATGTYSNNGTKGNPSLQADLLGDWREEAVWRTEDSTALRLYTTTELTEHRIPTLLHDPTYRLGVAAQNVGYNQPPHTSYFLGTGMAPPPRPPLAVGDIVEATLRLAPATWRTDGRRGSDLTALLRLPADAGDRTVVSARLFADGELLDPVSPPQLQRSGARPGTVVVRFDAADVSDALAGYTGRIELSVLASTLDGTTVTGSDVIRLRD